MIKKFVKFTQFISIIKDTLGNTGKDLMFWAKVISIVMNALSEKGISLEMDTRSMKEQVKAAEILSKLEEVA
jgi:hypothetical protein